MSNSSKMEMKMTSNGKKCRCNDIKSVLCKPSFDDGHSKKRHKKTHILCFLVMLVLFFGHKLCRCVLSVFVLLAVVDRVYFL